MAEIIINDLTQVKEYITQTSFVVAYLDYKILFGKFENDKFVFFNTEKIDIKLIQKVRVFNKDEELYLWRSGKDLCGRVRDDKHLEYEDSIQVLVGAKDEEVDADWCLVKESLKGVRFYLPGNFEINDEKSKVGIKVRNYIDYTENSLATYVDFRFVEFVQLPLEGGYDE